MTFKDGAAFTAADVLKPFAGLWGEPEHNITRAIFTPIQNPATAVAALLSGEIDMINPVPVQDADRIDAVDGVSVLRGIETRVIVQDDMVYVPLHVEPLLWGVRDEIDLTQRLDNFFILRWVAAN